ncbi:hypothetical protein ABZ383_19140 [Streptomyces sp. NPDC005900]|uniref:hypothetical protein n=1 Tax=Streptomyces sp. NPDC005900 TaxID=3154569 RepID=UPI0033EFCE21
MQDPSDSMEIAEPEENGRSSTAASPVGDDPTSTSDIDSTTASTVLMEVLPGVAVVAGEVPPELKPDLIDFGIVPAADRKQISAILASIGNAATVVGNLGNAFAGVQGLYRIGDTAQALLNSGATLAVKDGGNLGTVMVPGRMLHQARFYSVDAVSKAQTAASIGPALAMVGLQMMLSEVSGFVRTNLAVTSQVLTSIRKDHWAELTGLVAAIDRAVDQAREIESVPTSLWRTSRAVERCCKSSLSSTRGTSVTTSDRSGGPTHAATVSICRRTPRRSPSMSTRSCPPSRQDRVSRAPRREGESRWTRRCRRGAIRQGHRA